MGDSGCSPIVFLLGGRLDTELVQKLGASTLAETAFASTAQSHTIGDCRAVPPFSTFVVKVHELCNLNCTYCYMYNLADTSYRSRPKTMSWAVAHALFARIEEHAKQHRLSHVKVVIHGGEPLLVGKAYLGQWLTALRAVVKAPQELSIALQTNGVLLDAEWVELLAEHGVRVGISIDGPKQWHDLQRVDHRGVGSYDAVVRGLEILTTHKHGEAVFGSVLTVADPSIEPGVLWRFWRGLGVPRCDINLPHFTHDRQPSFSMDHLANWLHQLFEIWWTQDSNKIDVRFFRNIVFLILGAPYSTDYIGGKPGGIVVVETDGSVNGPDAIRACADGLIDLNVSLLESAFDEALKHPLVRLANHSGASVCQKCSECQVRDVCGGGYLPHRYSARNGFDNPSVYCDALIALITHVRGRIHGELATARLMPY